MIHELFAPPRLRLPDENRDRHTTWLETFYDLVFVVAVSALSSRLSGNLTLQGVLQFLALFIPVWWAWLGHTVYDTRFDTDDLFQRICTLGMMLAAAGMAIALPRVFEGEASLFATSYVIARICLLILYWRVHWRIKETRPITRLYLVGFSIGVSLWIVSLFVAAPLRYYLWGIGLLIDLVVPWIGRNILKHVPLDTSHLPERLGLFTIIILGQIVSVIVQGVSGNHVVSAQLLMAVLAFCLTVCIWWVYFTFLEAAPFAPRLSSGQPYIYIHFPLMIGLTIIGVSILHVIDEARGPLLQSSTRWLLGSGVVLWLVSALVLKRISVGESLPVTVVWRFAGFIGGIVFVLLLGAIFAPLLVFAGVVLVLGIFVVLDTRYWRRWTDGNGARQA